MKKLMMLLAAVLLSNTLLSASNYPPDYANQSAVAASAGPAVIAEVNTTFSGLKYAIGYKKSGILATGITNHVNAYVKVHYKLVPLNGGWATSMVSERNLKLLPEWNKTGYISGEIQQYTNYGTDGLIFVPSMALTYNYIEIEKIELAFYVNNKWDSNNGQNYVIDYKTLAHSMRFRSSYASQNIAIDTWDFIIGQMKK
ncbi:MAG: hypothetical protein HY746_07660 [Elusimicrobia bacterium]|nr:hypothetical protein [Elusimicrobiota bacterium]